LIGSMILEKALKEKPLTELQEFFSFWDGNGTAPVTAELIMPRLLDKMMDEDLVRKRLKFLSKKLLDILNFFLRSDSYSSNLQHILNSQVFSYMSQYEMEAALNALQKRGFLFRMETKLKRGRKERECLLIPEELGDILQHFLWDEEKEIYDTVSLEGFLSRLTFDKAVTGCRGLLLHEERKPEAHDDLLALLTEPAEIEHRIGLLGDEGLEAVVKKAVIEFGGILPGTIYKRIRKNLPPWDHRNWKKKLEQNMIGTVRHISLGEYGINQFDDTLVIFHEVVDTYMTEMSRIEMSAFTDIKTLGVDLVSDISSFLSFVSHNKIRLTLNGSIYRTAVKKVLESFILTNKLEFEDQDIFQYIYAFCLSKRMIQRRGDRNLSLTVKGKAWAHQPLEHKLLKLISFAFDEQEQDEDQFHMPFMKKMFVDYMKSLEINRWYDVMYLPFKCRNKYLADLDKNNIRDAFQNRYQYTQSTNMRDPGQLAHSLFQWIRNRFYLLGLVDLGFVEGKVVAMRLNPLGAKGLGITLPAEMEYKQNPLIVNPDFEIILFQDSESYDLIIQLDKFAVRTKSDHTIHFKITSSSLERAVAEGMTASQILALLSENSRVGIPQNVIYSIKEWAKNVKFVQMTQATLLRGRNKEILDRIVKAGVLKEFIIERLAPTVLLIGPDGDPVKIRKTLESLGIFLEGTDLNGE